jgi:phage terminase small subunit
MSLTDKQRRFVEAYLLEPNGTKAAVAAGYSESSAAVEANRLLKHAKVVAAIEERRKEITAATGVTPERVVAELAKIGFSDIREILRWRANVVGMIEDEDGNKRFAITNEVELRASDVITDDMAAAIMEISQGKDGALRVKMHPKQPALSKLTEILGFGLVQRQVRHERAALAQTLLPIRAREVPPGQFTR